MRLQRILASAAALFAVAAGQTPGEGSPTNDTVPIKTVIDVLSQSAQFSELLRHLQRTGLVPAINRLKNITLLAPVNGAFAGVSDDDVSREVLMYHLLNGTVATPEVDGELVFNSLLPSSADYNDGRDEYDISGEGMPVRLNRQADEDNGGTHVLINGQSAIVEADLWAEPRAWGIVQAVDAVLEIPRPLCEAVARLKDAHKFTRLLWLEYNCSSPDMLTAFVPLDDAFDAVFNDVEWNYLASAFGAEDARRLIQRHLVQAVIYPQTLVGAPQLFEACDGSSLAIDANMVVNGTHAPLSDGVVSANGVVRTYSELLGPHLVSFDAEKYLLSLGADQFVREALFSGLRDLLVDPNVTGQTILVPSSLVVAEASRLARRGMDNGPRPHGDPTPRLLYYFLDGQHDFFGAETAPGRYLATSKFAPRKLAGHPQRVNVVKARNDTVYVNWQLVEPRAYTIGNTTIYLVDGELHMPPALAVALGPFFQSSYSATFLDDLGLMQPRNGPWTYLLPTRTAWEHQALVRTYFARNTTALRQFFESHIFEGSFYSDSEPATLRMLDGTPADLEVRGKHLYINGTTAYRLDAGDILFDSGVAHSVRNLLIPPHISIAAGDLIAAASRSRFVDLLNEFNLTSALSLDSPTTILVPHVDMLERDGWLDPKRRDDLEQLLKMHLIPGNPLADLWDGKDVGTLENGVALTARSISDDAHFIQVANGEAKEAFVISSGDATPGSSGNYTTVLVLDRYISPEWIHKPFITPPFHLKTRTAILIGCVLGVLVASTLIVGIFWIGLIRKTQNKDGDERRPLLAEDGAHEDGDSDDDNEHNGDDRDRFNSVASGFSENSQSAPIRTAGVHEQRTFGRVLGGLPGDGGDV